MKNITLLHGWGSNIQKLESLRNELSLLGWKVYVPKIPGFDAPDPNEIWGNQEYATYVKNLSDKYFKNKNYFLFGSSFGGGLSIKLAITNSKNISGIVLCSAARVGKSTNPIIKTILTVLAKIGKIFFLVPSVGKFYRRVLYKLAGAQGFNQVNEHMKKIFKKVVSENFRDSVKNIKTPTLILWGDIDKLTPVENAYFLHNSIKNSKIKVFKNEGHRLPYDRPKDVSLEINTWYNLLK